MMRAFFRASVLAASVLLMQSGTAAAADYETLLSSANAMRWQSDAEWKLNLGAGFASAPKFEYAGDNELVFLPLVDIEWRNFVFASTQRGVGAKLVNNGRSEGGVRLLYDFGRNPTDDALLAGTSKVEATPQFGAYWVTYIGAWRWSADIRYATSSYESFVGTLGIANGGALSANTNIIAGIDTHYAGKGYNYAYFADGDASFNDITPFLQLIHNMDRGLYLSFDGRVSMLLGAAKKSSLTGSSSYSAGALVGKRF